MWYKWLKVRGGISSYSFPVKYPGLIKELIKQSKAIHGGEFRTAFRHQILWIFVPLFEHVWIF